MLGTRAARWWGQGEAAYDIGDQQLDGYVSGKLEHVTVVPAPRTWVGCRDEGLPCFGAMGGAMGGCQGSDMGTNHYSEQRTEAPQTHFLCAFHASVNCREDQSISTVLRLGNSLVLPLTAGAHIQRVLSDLETWQSPWQAR